MIYDYCIVGAGIVGLAAARALLERDSSASVAVIEKEKVIAGHQTSHNSGVIHSGVYYKPGSLKSQLCFEGARETKKLIADHGIDSRVCGKLIVATTADQLPGLAALSERAKLLGLRAEELDTAGVGRLEPAVRSLGGLHLPDVSIVNYQDVADAIASQIRGGGGEIRLSTPVIGIQERTDAVTVVTESGEVVARRLIVCGGLQADRLARLAGLDIDFQIVPFRGQYYQLRAQRNDLVNRLIYPIPDPEMPFLGIHLTRTMSGGITIGPNAVLAGHREGYRRSSVRLKDMAEYLRFPGLWRLGRKYGMVGVREMANLLFKRAYLAEARRYCPELTVADLEVGSSGIRAQALRRDGSLVDDFLFIHTDRSLHVGNAPSPAATAAIPIGRAIVNKIAA